MNAHVVWAVAVADFRERVRRPAYLVILAAAAGLAYLAIPASGSHWVTVDVGGYRGIYNSAWVGTVAALAGALWLSFAGFYIVRYSIERDKRTGVGQLLAATPMSTVAYFTGKFLSNLLVLASMVGVLAIGAAVLQLARGESTSLAPTALLTPFLLLTLPAVALTSAAALLFDTLPGLRAGLGNIAWFFIWITAVLLSVGGSPDMLGVQRFMDSTRAELALRHISIRAIDVSVGFTGISHPLKVFTWTGLDWSPLLAGGRLLLVLLAIGLAILPTLWFGRFDPARGQRGAHRRRRKRPKNLVATAHAFRPVPDAATHVGPRFSGRPRTEVRRGIALVRLFIGEWRVLMQGVSRWWWAGLVLLTVISLAVPLSNLRTALLADWIWPTLIWSRLGTQRHESGMDGLLGSYPSRLVRFTTEWAAGCLITALAAAGPLSRLALAGEWRSVAAMLVVVLLIPSLALALGRASRTHRLFQAVYVPLWYLALNGVAIVGILGVVPAEARPAKEWIAVAALALGMLAVALFLDTFRHMTR